MEDIVSERKCLNIEAESVQSRIDG